MKKAILPLVLACCMIILSVHASEKVTKACVREKLFPVNQFGSVEGVIKDNQDSTPVPFANIVLESGGKYIAGASSDLDGRYRITGISAGAYNLKVASIGYKPVLINGLMVSADKITFKNVSLEPTTEVLTEFVVVAYSVPLISKDQTSSGGTITSSDIRRMPGRSQGVHARKHGFVTSSDGSMGSVRGCRNDGTVTYIDGIRVKNGKDKTDLTPQPKANAESESESLYGKLTASELNDFSKWELWKDIKEEELKSFKDMWKVYPEKRYQVQVFNADNRPVADAVVSLKTHDGIIQWNSRTDNTGRAELWLNMFHGCENKTPEIVVSHNGTEYTITNPRVFSEGINAFRIPVVCDTPENVDIAFVVDATGSMNDEIAFLKSELIDITGKTKREFPDITLKLGSVFYRCPGNSYVTRTCDLTDDIEKVIDFIRAQSSGEGGPEAVEEALRVAIDSLSWSSKARSRLLFFVMDEQPLVTAEIINKMHQYINLAASKGIRIIPVIASAETPANARSLEYLMRSVALATNGTYVFLTDHSGIGDEHAKPVTDAYDVELLNNLIKRLIYSYCYMPPCNENVIAENIKDTTSFSNSTLVAKEITGRKSIKVNKVPGIFIKDFALTVMDEALLSQDMGQTSNENENSDVRKNKKMGVKFYPNPTSGMLTVEISGDVKEVYLSDLSGKLLSRINTTNKAHIEIDFSAYSTGIYFIRFFDSGRWYSEKIVFTR